MSDRHPPKPNEKLLACYDAASLRRRGLSEREAGSAQSVLTWLIKHTNPNDGRCDPSIAKLAFETGWSRDAVKRALAVLACYSIIEREERAGRTTQYNVMFNELSGGFLETEAKAKKLPSARAHRGECADAPPTQCTGAPQILKGEYVKEDIDPSPLEEATSGPVNQKRRLS